MGVPLEPRSSKMVSQVPEKASRTFQNNSLRYKKGPIAAINLSTAARILEVSFPVISKAPVYNSKFANLASAFGYWFLALGGRRQGAKPLNIYTYIYTCTQAMSGKLGNTLF